MNIITRDKVQFEYCDSYGWCKLKNIEGFLKNFYFVKEESGLYRQVYKNGKTYLYKKELLNNSKIVNINENYGYVRWNKSMEIPVKNPKPLDQVVEKADLKVLENRNSFQKKEIKQLKLQANANKKEIDILVFENNILKDILKRLRHENQELKNNTSLPNKLKVVTKRELLIDNKSKRL